jgi:glutamyl-tRNA synthetase
MSFTTRIAPSPTGLFHLGTARTALYSWLAARASGGRFILRIDDTDAARNDDAYTKVIFDAMDWLGLDYDDVFYQSKRSVIYDAAATMLLARDMAYLDNGALRLRLPADLPDTWTDSIKGPIKISDHDRKLIDGLVLFRSDGSPTYHFASVVDDYLMGVNYIIRGVDHLGNAPKHVAIRHALVAAGVVTNSPLDADPMYAHVGLIEIMKDDGTGKLKRTKMSKRDDAASLLKYRDAGYDPAALIDYMMRIGWAHTEHDYQKRVPFIDRDEALWVFLDRGKMRAAPSLFDPAMLAKSDRRAKAAAGIVHFGKGVVA